MAKEIDICERFGKRVRTLRKNRNMSQLELGRRCGLDRTYIVGIEFGRRNPGLRNIEKIAKALEISLSWLFRPLREKE